MVCGALTDEDVLFKVQSAQPVAASDEEEEKDEAQAIIGMNNARLFFSFERGKEETFHHIFAHYSKKCWLLPSRTNGRLQSGILSPTASQSQCTVVHKFH